MDLPARVRRPAMAVNNPTFARVAAALWRGDPPADEAVEALRVEGWAALDRAFAGGAAPAPVHALLASARATLDPRRVARASRLFFRTGPLGGVVLGARSLVAGYCSPAGNKPLVATGALRRDGARRLAETGRFVSEVHREGGMAPGARGWELTLRVRLMHAQTRRLLLDRGDWPAQRWGAPLNQHDLLATLFLFSVVWVDGLRTFGLSPTREEVEDHWHLWRGIGQVMGVEEGLLPRTARAAQTLSEQILATQGPPDDDARALVGALLKPPGGHGPGDVGEGLCRALLGPDLADGLGLPSTPWRHLPRAVAPLLRPLDALARRRPLEGWLVARGAAYWERAVAAGLGGSPERFAPPERLQ